MGRYPISTIMELRWDLKWISFTIFGAVLSGDGGNIWWYWVFRHRKWPEWTIFIYSMEYSVCTKKLLYTISPSFICPEQPMSPFPWFRYGQPITTQYHRAQHLDHGRKRGNAMWPWRRGGDPSHLQEVGKLGVSIVASRCGRDRQGLGGTPIGVTLSRWPFHSGERSVNVTLCIFEIS